MNFLNFNNVIINIENVNKISVQNDKIYIENNGRHYEYSFDDKDCSKVATELHEAFKTNCNVSIDVNVFDEMVK